MDGTFTQRMAASANSREAMLLLAEAADAIIAALEQPPVEIATADPWSAWEIPQTTALSLDELREVTEIEDLEEQARTATGEDLQAINAKLSLLKDTGGQIEEGMPRGRQEQVTETESDILVELPPPPLARRIDRANWIENKDLHTYFEHAPLSEKDTVDAFVKGGPLWLYHYDRSAVMQMPLEWRKAFVADIGLDSPATAQEVGRDILKADTETAQATVQPITGTDA